MKKKTNEAPLMIRDEKEADIFIRQLLNIGEAMYMAGGEISRIEESLYYLGKEYGANHVSVYAITSSIVITAEFPNDYSITQNRRITTGSSIDCMKMERLNQLCRDCKANPVPVAMLREKVLEIIEEKPDRKKIYLGRLLAVVSFNFLFGGNLADASVAAMGVAIICLVQQNLKKYFSSEVFFNVFVSFTTGIFVTFLGKIITGLHINEILISDIMILIPGISITNSIRYILSGDIVSSLEKLIDSLIQAFGIALGFMLSLVLMRFAIVNDIGGEAVSPLVQILSAGFGTMGFCMAFNMRRKYIYIPTIGGMICWWVYLICGTGDMSVFIRVLMASLAVGVYGDLMARAVKVPTTILYMPACVSLVPGSRLYYMALAMISSDWNSFVNNMILLSIYGVAISLGLAVVVEGDRTIKRIIYHSTKGNMED